MDFSDIAQRGLVLLGCGKMGSAMLEGWLSSGLPAQSVWALDPHPSAWLQQQDIHLNAALPSDPALVLVAVKPQLMQAALPQMSKLVMEPLYFYRSLRALQLPVLKRYWGRTLQLFGQCQTHQPRLDKVLRRYREITGSKNVTWYWPRAFWAPLARPFAWSMRRRWTRSRGCQARARPMCFI